MAKHEEWNNFTENTIFLFNRNIFFKSDVFNCEEEYRFCFLLDNTLINKQIIFNTKNNMLIPYISVPIAIDDIDINPIKSITLGPKNKSKLNRMSLEYLLKYNKLEHIQINESNIELQ